MQHYCELVPSPGAVARRVGDRHPRRRSGERDVSVIVMPGDVALSQAPAHAGVSPSLAPIAAAHAAADRELDTLAAMLERKLRITLFCGRGCPGAHDELMKLAEALKSPIVHALGGKEAVEYDNPYDVGMTGLIGFCLRLPRHA